MKKYSKKTQTRKNKKNTNRTRKLLQKFEKKGGLKGIHINEYYPVIENRDYSAFQYFLSHSTIKFINKGSFGYTFKAILSPEFIVQYPSPYNENITNKQVKFILFKILPIYNDKNEYKITDFKNEVFIQKITYETTLKKLGIPICPSIVYSKYYKKNEKTDEFFKDIIKYAENEETVNKTKELVKEIIPSNCTGFGIIAMEFAPNIYILPGKNYISLFDYIIKNNDIKEEKNIINLARFQILIMIYLTGYSHSDFNPNNFLVSPNHINKLERVLLIDFGQSIKVETNDLSNINFYIKSKQFKKALTYIVDNLKNHDGDYLKNMEQTFLNYNGKEYKQYSWIFEYMEEDIDENISKLFDEFIPSNNIVSQQIIPKYNYNTPNPLTQPRNLSMNQRSMNQRSMKQIKTPMPNPSQHELSQQKQIEETNNLLKWQTNS
jgi:hypothetical protein